MKPNPWDGSAFPFADPYREHGELSVQPGMTLLDYFAAQAMQGILASSNSQDEFANITDHTCNPAEKLHFKRVRVTKLAYEFARLMICEREAFYVNQMGDEA